MEVWTAYVLWVQATHLLTVASVMFISLIFGNFILMYLHGYVFVTNKCINVNS